MVANQERRGRPEKYTLPEIMCREVHARGRLAFEEKLLNGSLQSERDVIGFTSERGMDDAAEQEYLKLYDRFRDQALGTDAAEISIKDMLFVEGEEMNDQFPEEWGVRFFEHWVGTLPQDVVIFKRLPNYFQIVCESKKDYVTLMTALHPGEDFTHHTGVMHKRESIKLAGIEGRVNLMTVLGKENHQLTGKIVLHERQHVLNDLEMEELAELETKAFYGKKLYVESEDRTLVINELVHLKDELLARYREGQAAEDIKAAVQGYELFDRLEDLSGQLFVKTLALFDHIMDEFAALQPSLQTEKDYGLLVYQLTDIPLLDFPKYLRAYRSYLEQDVAQSVAAK